MVSCGLREFSTNAVKTYNFFAVVIKGIFNNIDEFADSDTFFTYQFSLVQLVTDKKLEAFNKS